MTDAHLSIGEVLTLLQDDFSDVTISKIRFLESQGLINPERTPSGYRKFYEPDIDRLRWILQQQRENFLPLKVIKERLDSDDFTVMDDVEHSEGTAADNGEKPGSTDLVEDDAASNVTLFSSEDDADPEAVAPEAEPQSQPIWMADLEASRGERKVAAAASLPLDAGDAITDVSLTATELCGAAGIDLDTLHELEQYGLVGGRPYGDDIYYDADALLIAKHSSGFFTHGIEARHLRMFKVAAEREAGFLEQVAMPMLKQRNPEARRQAVGMLEELADLGHDLRAALLRANLRRHLHRS